MDHYRQLERMMKEALVFIALISLGATLATMLVMETVSAVSIVMCVLYLTIAGLLSYEQPIRKWFRRRRWT